MSYKVKYAHPACLIPHNTAGGQKQRNAPWPHGCDGLMKHSVGVGGEQLDRDVQ